MLSPARVETFRARVRVADDFCRQLAVEIVQPG
jgi:hypothetical protein